MKWGRLFIFFALMTLMSCKKDKLKGDKEIFIGTWDWIFTDATLGVCENMPYSKLLDPATENCEYSISFEKKGKVLFFKNGTKVNEFRVVFQNFDFQYYCSNGYKAFAINLDNYQGTNPEGGIQGCISSDTLMVDIGFPFYSDECSFYSNYFVKH